MRDYIRVLLLTASCATVPAMACSPSRDYKPPSVREAFKAATYVVHAKVMGLDESGDGRRAQVHVLEQFKGPALKSIGAPGHGCGLSVSIGETRVFFLNSLANGHVMVYPSGKSEHEILQELRELTSTNNQEQN
jgi:hypothetical protein